MGPTEVGRGRKEEKNPKQVMKMMVGTWHHVMVGTRYVTSLLTGIPHAMTCPAS